MEEPAKHKPGPWVIYAIALSAIVLPSFLLFMVGSIPTDRLDFTDVRSAAGRGDFLIPVTILCAEAIRCWAYEFEPGSSVGRNFRAGAYVVCVATGIACFAAALVGASMQSTAAIGRSLVTITMWGVGFAALAGLFAVGASRSGR